MTTMQRIAEIPELNKKAFYFNVLKYQQNIIYN